MKKVIDVYGNDVWVNFNNVSYLDYNSETVYNHQCSRLYFGSRTLLVRTESLPDLSEVLK